MSVNCKDVKPFATALTLIAMACASYAQTQTPAAQEEGGQALNEVTVTADALDLDDSRPKTVSTATKTQLDTKDVPQTVTTLEVSKYKVYGINDLSVLLDGVPGVDTTYDMRGEGVLIRGFSADSGDMYRDGIRTSGQIRRSTANIERIEILKGPAAVLYGRGAGGGVVNMISKQANFDAVSSLGLRLGSYGNRGGTLDVNRVVSDNVAVRLTADYEQADSFRRGIKSRNKMVSPSIAYDNHQGLTWLGQYTWDSVWRRPDRAPSYNNLPPDVSYRTAYAHPDDYVEDQMEMFRSVLGYDFGNGWSAKWTLGLHEANQDFDHLYGGNYCKPDGTRYSNGARCNTPGLMTFTRAWQVTSNRTLSNAIDVTGKAQTFGIEHELLVGVESTQEKRNPDLSTSATNSDPAMAYTAGVDPYNPVWTDSKLPYGPAKTSNRHRAKAHALYVQDLMSLTTQWKVMAGLRWDSYSFRSHNLITNGMRSYSGSTVSPRVGLIWQPVEQHSLYASYSKNFSPYGGRGTLGVSVNEDAVFDTEPQYSRQYEVGVKSDWLGNRFSTQVAVYNLEKYNVRYQPDAENDPYTWAVRGNERSRGIEASLTGQVAPHWYVRSGVGVQKAIVVSDAATPANEGKQLANTARKTGNAFVRFVPRNDWYGELGVTYRGESYTSLANTSQRAGYARWDASIGWRPLPWTVTLAVTNLADKRYWRDSSMPGAPRTFLLSANYLF
ncbi:TonB-dependent siderophore receptor [Lampropedia puyangensis]|uniref:TonB-dependent siderophore receptor n=1 Tax=Lampropedia puyangensis TaxID=1330072 RepID=A0A4S8EZ77_9BURK|nr:TonB-dependent siderophore receptor [Lampropedia puyangensis]THT99254.1 TonB-dependent siderophore receptor [Lampropedia puyangensis]